ncbi:MAG: histidinol-phosphate transaminase [Deltaproteobacteria bacterium]|jgi:histidinol-phosphate aminotransferase|nr:histidinol-phosphate transaminase [Deltaproteobacteria bacterium]MBT7203080.1 histidinol-phosphate transaminase [Deltaproteobacteria bacterium]
MAPLEKILRPELMEIPPYNTGLGLNEVRSRYGITAVAKLSSNENPTGPAPQVLECLSQANSELYLYPNSEALPLRKAIAQRLDVPEKQIIFGNGSEELISIICRSTINSGDRVITLFPSFPLHEDYTKLMGGSVERLVINDNLQIDLAKLVERAAQPAKLLIFSNPMNPSGSWLNPEQLRQLFEAKHPETLLVLDEAYHEYAVHGDYTSGLELTERIKGHWILLRTFSKSWGLAGLRIGFGVCSSTELRQALDRTRTPFNINSLAQIAAKVALDHEDYMLNSVQQTILQREHLAKELRSRGYQVGESLGNFLFINANRSSAKFAEELLKLGTIVKPWPQPGYDTFLRVSIGTPAENEKFLVDLAQVEAS